MFLALEVLAAESGLSGLGAGRIAVGVRDDVERWWLAELGPKAHTEMLEARPTGCDFQLLLGPTEAEAIVEGRFPTTPTLLEARGDVRLLRRFVERLRPKTWLEVRAGGKT